MREAEDLEPGRWPGLGPQQPEKPASRLIKPPRPGASSAEARAEVVE